MKHLSPTRLLVIPALALLAATANLHATVDFSVGGTVVTNQGVQSSVSGTTTVDFNDVNVTTQGTTYTSGIVTVTGATAGSVSQSGTFVQGSVGSQYAAPAGNTSQYIAVGGSQRPGPITVTFSTPLSYFGFSWTTPDTYNNVQFFNGATQIASFTPGTNTPGLTGSGSSGFANFTATGGDQITSAVFSSSGIAFETDNFAYIVVPEPSSVALSLTALGVTGAVLWRRRRAVRLA